MTARRCGGLWRFAALLAGGACAHPSPGAASDPVEIERREITYSVNPMSAADLQRSISDQWRCAGGDCKTGETAWRLLWNFSTVPRSPTLCAMTSVHVKLDVTVTVPRWDPPAGTSSARRQWWFNIESSLSKHEYEHVRIAEDGAHAIASALQPLTAPDCRTLAANAETAARRAEDDMKAAQAAFDASQGVMQITPPPP